MTYSIHITLSAERDLLSAADYIEFTLNNPLAANELLEKVEVKISELSTFPEAHPVIDDPILSTWGIRVLGIDNYIVFYTIVDDTIYIVRFLYKKRDWISILKQGFSLK